MKISGYEKDQNNNVTLKLDYNDLDKFDKVYISKVFTDTYIPEDILTLSNIEYGGTGFFYDKAPPLPDYIEHHKPDYHLYDEWVNEQINNKIIIKEKKLNKTLTKKQIDKIRDNYKYFLDYSIGFTTRFCFRGCKFCVNQNYKEVLKWSPLNEFIDLNKPKICLLDDNVFGCKTWKQILFELQQINKPFQYKQGLDERLLTEEKIKILFNSRYDGDFIFAFDNINDAELIKSKLKLIRRHYKNKGRNIKFYVLCAFDEKEKNEDEEVKKQAYSKDFWAKDVKNTFERIKILMEYNCLPYIMRYEKYNISPYYGTYVNLASWCNQPNMFKKKSYRQWCIDDDKRKGGNSATIRYLKQFENDYPQIAKEYFDLKFEDINKY